MKRIFRRAGVGLEIPVSGDDVQQIAQQGCDSTNGRPYCGWWAAILFRLNSSF
jgi:hypothetical protein